MSFITQDKCGLGHIYTPPGRAGPAELQGRRGGELTGWGVGLCTCRDDLPKSSCLRLLLKTLAEKAYIS